MAASTRPPAPGARFTACTMHRPRGRRPTTSPVVPPPLTPTSTATGTSTPTSHLPARPPADRAAAYCQSVRRHRAVESADVQHQQRRESAGSIGEPVARVRVPVRYGPARRPGSAVDLVTLYSSQPTLAALAYLAKKPLPAWRPTRTSTRPALGCLALGGTDAFGTVRRTPPAAARDRIRKTRASRPARSPTARSSRSGASPTTRRTTSAART